MSVLLQQRNTGVCTLACIDHLIPFSRSALPQSSSSLSHHTRSLSPPLWHSGPALQYIYIVYSFSQVLHIDEVTVTAAYIKALAVKQILKMNSDFQPRGSLKPKRCHLYLHNQYISTFRKMSFILNKLILFYFTLNKHWPFVI